MNIGFIISTVFEILLGGFIVWGFLNEQKLVAFEDKMFAKVKSHFTKPYSSVRLKGKL